MVFRSHKTPELTIFKEDSMVGAPIEGAKFHVTYTSNGEATGAPASIDFAIFVTDASDQINLHKKGKKLYPEEYTVTEVEPAPGFQMKEPLTQKVIHLDGESKTLTFFNDPLNAIVVEKYDSVTHEALTVRIVSSFFYGIAAELLLRKFCQKKAFLFTPAAVERFRCSRRSLRTV